MWEDQEVSLLRVVWLCSSHTGKLLASESTLIWKQLICTLPSLPQIVSRDGGQAEFVQNKQLPTDKCPLTPIRLRFRLLSSKTSFLRKEEWFFTFLHSFHLLSTYSVLETVVVTENKWLRREPLLGLSLWSSQRDGHIIK